MYHCIKLCECKDSTENGWKTIEQMQKGSADGIEGMGRMRRIVRYFAVMALLTSSAAIAFVMLYNNVSSFPSRIVDDLARSYLPRIFLVGYEASHERYCQHHSESSRCRDLDPLFHLLGSHIKLLTAHHGLHCALPQTGPATASSPRSRPLIM
jgi:hypothetical protein